uniref:Uncharacterized protein n=1 Tax=Knipowitschia caucasica TaxID=637954 RepID=A0AAV2LG23_KNICA
MTATDAKVANAATGGSHRDIAAPAGGLRLQQTPGLHTLFTATTDTTHPAPVQCEARSVEQERRTWARDSRSEADIKSSVTPQDPLDPLKFTLTNCGPGREK